MEKVQDSARSMNRALQLSCRLMLATTPQLVAETKTMSLSNAAKLTTGADEEVALLFRTPALHSTLNLHPAHSLVADPAQAAVAKKLQLEQK